MLFWYSFRVRKNFFDEGELTFGVTNSVAEHGYPARVALGISRNVIRKSANELAQVARFGCFKFKIDFHLWGYGGTARNRLQGVSQSFSHSVLDIFPERLIVWLMKMKYTKQIKALKPATGFVVDGEKERKKVLEEARLLRNAGVIEFRVATSEMENGKFNVGAI